MAEKKKSIILIVVIIVVCLLFAGGISYFIAMRFLANTTTDQTQPPGVFVQVGDPKEGLVVNVGGVDSGHYLKIGLTLEMKPDKNDQGTEGKTLSPEEIKIEDAVDFVLRSQDISNFAPDRQDYLKNAIKNAVNTALGEDRVYNVYITNFVFQ